MPPIPTVQKRSIPSQDRSRDTSGLDPQRKSDLVVSVKYTNNLPDIPFDPKFLKYPFESNRFIEYKATSLERNHVWDLLTEHDLGIPIDLIDQTKYEPVKGQHHATDEKLLEDEGHVHQNSKRSRHHAKTVSWLRRTEYISTETTRFQPQTIDKAEAKVGFNVKRNLQEKNLYADRESQISSIEKTFEDAKKPVLKHPSKPGVTAVEELPVFPDFDLWKFPFAQVMFDADPAPPDVDPASQEELMSQAMIRGVMDESGEQFVAYFLPTKETLEKRREDFTLSRSFVEGLEYDYKMAREYNWNVKNKSTNGYEETFFFIFRDGVCTYDELETRVRLNRRRQTPGSKQVTTRLVIKHRPVNKQEFREQRKRERALDERGAEADDEMESEDEAEEQDDDEESANKGDAVNDEEMEVEGDRTVEVESAVKNAGKKDESVDGIGEGNVNDEGRSANRSSSSSEDESGGGKARDSLTECQNDVEETENVASDDSPRKPGGDVKDSDVELTQIEGEKAPSIGGSSSSSSDDD